MDGNWFFKSNEDGIFVKVNDQRIKNRLGNLMEEVIGVKECRPNARNTQYIAVSSINIFPCRKLPNRRLVFEARGTLTGIRKTSKYHMDLVVSLVCYYNNTNTTVRGKE